MALSYKGYSYSQKWNRPINLISLTHLNEFSQPNQKSWKNFKNRAILLTEINFIFSLKYWMLLFLRQELIYIHFSELQLLPDVTLPKSLSGVLNDNWGDSVADTFRLIVTCMNFTHYFPGVINANDGRRAEVYLPSSNDLFKCLPKYETDNSTRQHSRVWRLHPTFWQLANQMLPKSRLCDENSGLHWQNGVWKLGKFLGATSMNFLKQYHPKVIIKLSPKLLSHKSFLKD